MQGNTAVRINWANKGANKAATIEAKLASLDADSVADGNGPPDDESRSVALLRLELGQSRASLAQVRDAYERTSASLRCARSELRMVSAALISSQEMERARIACELHDSIGQALGSVGFGIGGALESLRAGDARAAEQMLVRLADQTKRTIGEVRRIAMDLRPATLDHLGIVGTLSWFFREFRAFHPALSVVTDIDVSEPEVPAPLTTAIFRVAQEACNNVVRHAGASRIRVALQHRPGWIRLCVEDDGCGMSGDDLTRLGRHGMGLRSMRDRVEFSGGNFQVNSEPGTGTSIVANWPVSAPCCEMPDSGEHGMVPITTES